jgi:hypothetical protein
LGLEIALSSHLPHTQEWVLERRFGDCKDKALLLVAFLRALGFRAWPALVNSTWQGAVADWLASSDSFDHAIVMVELDGQSVFVDATQNLIRGPLDDLGPPPFQKALLVDAATSSLTDMGHATRDSPTLDVVQSWVAQASKGDLTVTTTATKEDAIEWRHRIAEQSKETLAKGLKDDREALYQTALTPLSLQLKDDTATNTVHIEEHYQVEPFFDGTGQRQLITEVSRAFPLAPAPGEDAQVFAVAHPVNLRERIEVTAFDAVPPSAPTPIHVRSPAANLDIVSEVTGQTLKITYHYRSLSDRVAPEAFASLKKTFKEMQDGATFLYHPQMAVAARVKNGELFRGSVAALVLLTGATALLLWMLMRRRLAVRAVEERTAPNRLVKFREQSQHAKAESASSAQRIDNVNSASAYFSKRCSNGHALEGDIVTIDTLRLSDDTVTVMARRCPTCREQERRYFVLP